jgi:hypothetical protein
VPRQPKNVAEGTVFYDLPVTHASIIRITKDGIIKVKEGQTVIVFTATELPPLTKKG